MNWRYYRSLPNRLATGEASAVEYFGVGFFVGTLVGGPATRSVSRASFAAGRELALAGDAAAQGVDDGIRAFSNDVARATAKSAPAAAQAPAAVEASLNMTEAAAQAALANELTADAAAGSEAIPALTEAADAAGAAGQGSAAQPLHTLDVINPEAAGGRGSWSPLTDVRNFSLARGEVGHERGTVGLLVTDQTTMLVGTEKTGVLPTKVGNLLEQGMLAVRNSTTKMDISLLNLDVNASHPDTFLLNAADDAGLQPWFLFLSRDPCFDIGGGPCCLTFLTNRGIDWMVAPR
jgi:hypothetical protein